MLACRALLRSCDLSPNPCNLKRTPQPKFISTSRHFNLENSDSISIDRNPKPPPRSTYFKDRPFSKRSSFARPLLTHRFSSGRAKRLVKEDASQVQTRAQKARRHPLRHRRCRCARIHHPPSQARMFFPSPSPPPPPLPQNLAHPSTCHLEEVGGGKDSTGGNI